MASKHTAADINRIGIQQDADSIPFDDNFQDLKNKDNEIIDAIDDLLSPPVGNEVPNARTQHDNLNARLNSIWDGQANYIKYGGVVTLNSTAQTVDVTAGEAKINGVDVVWAAATSNTINYCTGGSAGGERYDVVVINSDGSLSIATGTESNDPVLPAVSETQKALAVLYITGDSITINNDARNQGAWYYHDGQYKYTWKIQTAIDDLEDDEGGEIVIGGNKSKYYEEIDLTGKNYITLRFQNNARLYRISATNFCIKSINSEGNETVGIRIYGVDLRGNSQVGNNELIKLTFTDEFIVDDIRFDGNTLSSAAHKNMVIQNCDKYKLGDNFYFDGSGNDDKSTYHEDTVTQQKRYDTGWINTNDWANRHLGTDFNPKNVDSNVTHNMNANLSELLVKILISEDGTDNNSREVVVAGEDPGGSDEYGLTIFQVDKNNVKIQTGAQGIQTVNDDGTVGVLDNEDWYYKIAVYRLI
jgi:hypothetical protein